MNVYIHEGGAVVCQENKDFWKYIEAKSITRGQVLNLSPQKRRELFLLWKNGMSNPATNEEIESTKQMIYYRTKDTPLDLIPIEWREWVKNEREFESYCQSIRSQIGLGIQEKPKTVEQPAWSE